MSRSILTIILKAIIAIGFVVALFVWLAAHYQMSDLTEQWLRLPGSLVVMASLMIIASHVIRAMRVHFAYSLVCPQPLARVLSVSLVHNTVSFLLPMRLGEAALPVLSKQQLDVDIKYSTATLVLIRLFDAHVLLCLLCFFAGGLFLEGAAWIAPIVLLAGLPVFIYLLRAISHRVPKIAFAKPLFASHPNWLRLYAYTIAIWVIKLFALAMLAATLGNLPIDHAWIATIIADGSALSPLTGLANAGTFQAAFSLPLLPLGYNAQQLVLIAVNVHVFIFIINMLAGISGFIGLRSRATPPTSHS